MAELLDWKANSRALKQLRADLSVDVDMQSLTTKNYGIVARDITVDLGIIVGVAILCEWAFSWPLYIVSIMIIGGRQCGIGTIALHDGAHRFVAKDNKVNDSVCRTLLAALTVPLLDYGLIGYRSSHTDHHRYMLTEKDLTAEFFVSMHRQSQAKTIWEMIKMTALSLSGVAYFGLLFNKILTGTWELRLMALGILSFLIAAVTSQFYPALLIAMYWFVPLATWALLANAIRTIAEHYPPESHASERSKQYDLLTRDIKASWFDKVFVTPRNVNLHLSHHLFPAVPYYNLAALHRQISRKPRYQQLAHVNRGYHHFLQTFLFSRFATHGK